MNQFLLWSRTFVEGDKLTLSKYAQCPSWKPDMVIEILHCYYSNWKYQRPYKGFFFKLILDINCIVYCKHKKKKIAYNVHLNIIQLQLF